MLHWRPWDIVTVHLLPHVIPSTLRVLMLGCDYRGAFIAGAIPSTARWAKLPETYRERVDELQLSAVSKYHSAMASKGVMTTLCSAACILLSQLTFSRTGQSVLYNTLQARWHCLQRCDGGTGPIGCHITLCTASVLR